MLDSGTAGWSSVCCNPGEGMAFLVNLKDACYKMFQEGFMKLLVVSCIGFKVIEGGIVIKGFKKGFCREV